MELKKSMVLSLLACTAVFSATIFSPGIVQAEEAAASGETTAAAPADAAAIVQQEAQKNGYTYTSERLPLNKDVNKVKLHIGTWEKEEDTFTIRMAVQEDDLFTF